MDAPTAKFGFSAGPNARARREFLPWCKNFSCAREWISGSEAAFPPLANRFGCKLPTVRVRVLAVFAHPTSSFAPLLKRFRRPFGISPRRFTSPRGRLATSVATGDRLSPRHKAIGRLKSRLTPAVPRWPGDNGTSLLKSLRSRGRTRTLPREGQFPRTELNFAYAERDFASQALARVPRSAIRERLRAHLSARIPRGSSTTITRSA